MSIVRALIAAMIPAYVVATHFVALAEQTYTVTGRDSFSIGAGDIQSEVDYRGRATLRITRRGRSVHLVARVAYVRSDGDASSRATGEFITNLGPDGTTIDSSDRDPDYLTVLNQPFAALLDRATLADLKHLQGALPFDVPSPFTSSSLHGYLQHVAGGSIAGKTTIGVRFEADGPMQGELPDRPGLTLAGTIAMRGTAYYDSVTSLLLALDTTVTITGNVSNRSDRDPVTIVYARTIHAGDDR